MRLSVGRVCAGPGSRWLRATWLCLSTAFVTSCAPLRQPVETLTILPQPLERFRLEGRISVKSGEQAFSGGIRWQHDGPRDEILLTAPMGQGVAQLRREPDRVRLITAEGREYEAASGEALLERVLTVLEKLNDQPFPEERVDKLLEESYGPLAEEYQEKAWQGYRDARTQLEQLSGLSSATQDLTAQYEALFDGVVCVPEAVWAEFEKAEQEDSWEALLFTLTLPSQRLGYLKSQGKASFDPSYKVYKLSLPYDAEKGLTYTEGEERPTEYLILD
jgi:hypothetical protein